MCAGNIEGLVHYGRRWSATTGSIGPATQGLYQYEYVFALRQMWLRLDWFLLYGAKYARVTNTGGMGSSSMATSGMAGFGNAPIKQSSEFISKLLLWTWEKSACCIKNISLFNDVFVESLGETIFASLRSWTDSKLIQNSSSSAAAYPMSYGNYRAISLEAPPLEGSKPQPAAFSGTLSPAATRAVTPPSAARPASAKRVG